MTMMFHEITRITTVYFEITEITIHHLNLFALNPRRSNQEEEVNGDTSREAAYSEVWAMQGGGPLKVDMWKAYLMLID